MNGQILSGTHIAVDFWKITGKQENFVHFLTHIHGDHIVGLTSSWTHPIYCSAFTSQILQDHYGLCKSLLKVLPLNQSSLVKMPCSEESFCVTAFDANHCPGAVMFYFEGKFGNILHTGDFRFSREMFTEDLYHLRGKIDKLYLDNTFCSPHCIFPSREECLQQIIDICQKYPSSEIIIGVRKLGKESMLAKLGVALNETIQVSPERYMISQLLFNTNIFSVPIQHFEGRIKTLPLHEITRKLLFELNESRPTIAILPTAIYTGLPCKPFSRDPYIHIVPYSDHSSFPELVEFVKELRPKQLIPVVQHSRGPFGTDTSDRTDMVSLKSYLTADADDLGRRNKCIDDIPSVHSNETEFGKDKRQFSNADLKEDHIVSTSVDESSGDQMANGDHKKFFLRRYDESFSEGCTLTLTRSALKRKQSFPNKRKRKVAKGVVFQDIDEDEDGTHVVESHVPPGNVAPKCNLNPTYNDGKDVWPDWPFAQEEIRETIPFLTDSEEGVSVSGDSSFDKEANSFNHCDEHKMGSHSRFQERENNSDTAEDGRESCSVREPRQSDASCGTVCIITGLNDQGVNAIPTAADQKCFSTGSKHSTYKSEEVCGDDDISHKEVSSSVFEEGLDKTNAEILIISSDDSDSTSSTDSDHFLRQRTAGKAVSNQNCNYSGVKDANQRTAGKAVSNQDCSYTEMNDAVCSAGTSRSKGFRSVAHNKKKNKLLDISRLSAHWNTEGDIMNEDNFASGTKNMQSICLEGDDKDEFYKAVKKLV